MGNQDIVVYFGAAGAGQSYCDHTGTVPDFFVDNDPGKWGTELCGKEVKSPQATDWDAVSSVVITSGYIKSITAQLQDDLNVNPAKVVIPAKALLGKHPFSTEANRQEAAAILANVYEACAEHFKLVAVGGTALGFCRDSDFITWDFDIDLFAPVQGKDLLFKTLQDQGAEPFYKNDISLGAFFILSTGERVPVGIDLFDATAEKYVDRYEDYVWEWPISMFTDCEALNIQGQTFYVPAPHNKYLSGVYGDSWKTPNKNFGYSDYNN